MEIMREAFVRKFGEKAILRGGLVVDTHRVDNQKRRGYLRYIHQKVRHTWYEVLREELEGLTLMELRDVADKVTKFGDRNQFLEEASKRVEDFDRKWAEAYKLVKVKYPRRK